VATTRPTTHSDPVYVEEGVTHYAVANMPGAVPNTATHALCNATLPYVLELAGQGVEGAVRRDEALGRGVNVYRGVLVNREVGGAVGLPARELTDVLREAA
jgi:alanine dehydrogenase